MAGELAGVAIIATLSALGVSVLLQYEMLFTLFKYCGGVYLGYLGVMMWQSKGKLSFSLERENFNVARWQLALQGFFTAIANPKGWAFFIAFLPPFIDPSKEIAPQLVILVSMILVLEAMSLVIYASSGSALRKLLGKSGNVKILNKISGSLMIFVGVWLALS